MYFNLQKIVQCSICTFSRRKQPHFYESIHLQAGGWDLAIIFDTPIHNIF